MVEPSHGQIRLSRISRLHLESLVGLSATLLSQVMQSRESDRGRKQVTTDALNLYMGE